MTGLSYQNTSLVCRAPAAATTESQPTPMGSPAPPTASQKSPSGPEESSSQMSDEEERSDGSAVGPDPEGSMDCTVSESSLQDAQVLQSLACSKKNRF